MTHKIEAFLDNLQAQSTLGKLLLPLLVLFGIIISVVFFSGSVVSLTVIIGATLAFYMALNI